MGERSLSMTKVKGFEIAGNRYLESDLVDHLEIKIVTEDSRAAKIRDMIVRTAHTGFQGDGVVAILPVEEFTRIRDVKPK
jgi:nitrogen regulatory protein PII